MFCSCRGVSLSQELCCTQLARLFAREHSNREKRVKFDQGFTVHSAIHDKRLSGRMGFPGPRSTVRMGTLTPIFTVKWGSWDPYYTGRLGIPL